MIVEETPKKKGRKRKLASESSGKRRSKRTKTTNVEESPDVQVGISRNTILF